MRLAVRPSRPSPFGDGRLYLGGYDANHTPSDGTAWAATIDPTTISNTGP